MPAYVINDMTITDPDLLDDYKKLSPATIAQYGGRFLSRGGALSVLEGDWHPKRVVILEFPDRERAEAWINSAEYAPAREMRQHASQSNIILVEGTAP